MPRRRVFSEVANTASLLGNPDSPGAVWWRNASLPTELMGLRACGYRLRSVSCRGLAGGRGALPTSPLNSPLRLRVDGLCYLLCAAVARRRLYPYPANGDSGLVAGPTEPGLYIGALALFWPRSGSYNPTTPHLVHVRGHHRGARTLHLYAGPLLLAEIVDLPHVPVL